MKQSGIQKRAARRNRNTSSVDLNLVSLIDIFDPDLFLLFNMASPRSCPIPKHCC
jgi:hypothetical protein